MTDAAGKVISTALVEFGVLVTIGVVMVGIVAGAFVWMLVKINPTQQKIVQQQQAISESQKQISSTLVLISTNLAAQSVTFGVHDQRATDMHATCKVHGDQIGDIYDKIGETVKAMAELTKETANLTKEMAVLKAIVNKQG